MNIFSLILFVFVAKSFCEKEEETLGTIIGIDLGTTFSRVGVIKDGRVQIIANEQGIETPSYVAFTGEQEEQLIGYAAKKQLTSNPKNTIFDVKRLIGRFYNDKIVQDDIRNWPFKVVDKLNKPTFEVKAGSDTKQFTPEDVSAMILTEMKHMAESYFGHEVKNAVITVPAYFNNEQRQSTRDAVNQAGLNVVRIISEPTAAATAYGLNKIEGARNILVLDLGGGSFDVSLLTVEKGVYEIVATNGDVHLGGRDLDQRVMEYFMKVFNEKTGKDLRQDSIAIQMLRQEVETAKIALSTQHEIKIEIKSLHDGEDFSETLTRTKFDKLNMDLYHTIIQSVENVLDDAFMNKTDVHDIVLVGGSSRIPKIQQLIKEFFNGKEPTRGINPDEAVAYGAAIQGGISGGVEIKRNGNRLVASTKTNIKEKEELTGDQEDQDKQPAENHHDL
ncbi:hypothetical protein B9Z55_024080 [Caenorhabditis nigoni]|uniref:Uncharacterized protein n=1 Tax=Caenorhabditis nigoni TaxID=1611254 RepID=A0A2G5SSW3_9PELO|nr:hypothetical protein B9Z55_024080 [Caenorhabditis nigoni]